MIVGAIGLVLLVVCGAVEFWAYQEAAWWHSDAKADQRNWTPPR